MKHNIDIVNILTQWLALFIFYLGLTQSLLCTAVSSDISEEVELRDIVVIILNQNEYHHIKKAHILRRNLIQDSESLNVSISVKISTEDLEDVASWIYIPLAKRLLDEKIQGIWYVFIEEFCEVSLGKLQNFLKDYNENQDLYFGRGLQDETPTIIHHFDAVHPKNPFGYPDSRTGIILSRGLMERLSSEWNPLQNKMDFSIDASYEFSKVILSFGVKLEDSKFICIEKEDHCIIWVDESSFSLDEKMRPVSLQRIHFAVKTCKRYFQDRLPVLKDTWLAEVPNYGLYSDVKDDSLGTISLNIPNTDRGHCGKTMAIIRHAAKIRDIDWLVIVDDDTLLSARRLSRFLVFYDPSSAIALGERYAYMIASGAGFNYLTGGAGMVLSKRAVTLLSEKGVCECPSIDTPDDMFLGSCLQRYQVPIIHSRRFHQARPEDYPSPILKGSSPISFHKFWMIDPRKSYKRWFTEPHLPSSENPLVKPSTQHTEL